MERITNFQLYAMMVLFQVGTTIVFGFASDAGRDAWIIVLLTTAIGTIFNIIYLLLMQMSPELTLIEAYILNFGKWLGAPIAWAYTLFLIYITARTLGDLRFLIPLTILPKTSIVIVLAIFMFAIGYEIFNGIEVIVRLSELFLPLILMVFIIEVILIFSSDIMNFHNLQPILSNGLKPNLKSIFPIGISIGFGESIVFFMIWPSTQQSKTTIKTAILATITSGLLITCFDILSIVVLGEGLFKNSIYPLLTLVKQITIGNFIENLDVIEVLYFLTTSFIKISVYCYAVSKSIEKLTVVKNYRIYILPTSIIILYLSMTMSSSVSNHSETIFDLKIFISSILFYYVLPIILLMVLFIKKLRMKKN